YGTTGTPTLNAGLRVDQGTQTDQFWLFDQGRMDWGKKSGSGGSFDKALFKSDLFPNDPIRQSGASDNVDFNNLERSGTLDVAGIADFQDNVIIRDQIGSENFFPGFGGNGWSHRKEGSSYALDTDRVTISEYLWAYEFIINKISSIGGSEILSAANGKIESVGSGEITISDPVNDTNKVTEFAVDDLIMMKEAGVDTAHTLISTKVVRVTGITNNVVSYSETGAGLSGAPTGGSFEAGQVVVAFGNTTDASRQGIQYRSTVDSGAPFYRILEGIDSWSAWKNSLPIVEFGNLDGRTVNGASLSGDGYYSQNSYLTGNLIVGDLTKTDNYLAYENGNLSADLEDLYITDNDGFLLDTENKNYEFKGTVVVTGGNAETEQGAQEKVDAVEI